MYDIKEDDTLEGLLECHGLAKLHYSELMDGKELELDLNLITSFYEAGMMVLTTVKKEGELVAYYMNLLQNDFMTGDKIAKELAIYVSKEHRGGRLFFKLSDFNTNLLKSKGVVTQYITFVHGHNDKLPLRLGFKPAEVTYKKSLEE